jgi:hypothetical protein
MSRPAGWVVKAAEGSMYMSSLKSLKGNLKGVNYVYLSQVQE